MGLLSSPIAALSMATPISDAISGAMGSYYGAKAQASNLRYQSSISDINARLSELDAQAELKKGRHHVGALTMRAGQLKSSQRAALAANGIALDEGSAAEVQESADIEKDIDVEAIQANALRSAWGYRTQGTRFATESRMQAAAAKATSPRAAAATSLLGSASGLHHRWYHRRAAPRGSR